MSNVLPYSESLPQMRPPVSSGTQMMIGRQSQEVQAAIFLAKQFPRDEEVALQRILQQCKRKKLAEEAEYEFPKGGTKVNGPSIRLAEVIAQCWGNIDYGIIELEQKPDRSEAMAYAWDLETNVRRTMHFTVPHIRVTKKGTQHLDDPRDKYEIFANLGARRVRACILGIIPGDVIDQALEACRQTIKDSYKEPLSERIPKMLDVFLKEFKVTQQMIEEYIGVKVEAISENDFIRLSNIYRSLRDGMAKPEAYFKMNGASADTGKSKAEEEFAAAERYAAEKAQAAQSAAGGDPGDAGDGLQDELDFE